MSDSNPNRTRRSVLKTVGGALAVASVSGLASAETTTDELFVGQCVYADGNDGEVGVFDSCGSDIYWESAENNTTGTVKQTCKDFYGDEWGYVRWDDSTPDGWVPASGLTACATTNE